MNYTFLPKFILTLSVFSLATFANAQAPFGYYATVDTSNGTVLRNSLHEVIDGHTRISFDESPPTFAILEDADADPNNPNQILDIYGNNAYTEVNSGSGDYNREHIWPRSYGFPDNDDSGRFPISDLHSLFLSDNGYNFSRGNEYYDNCNGSCSEFVTVPNNGAGGGSGIFPGNSNWSDSDSWQVWVGRQGDAARALFYMDVRYEPLTQTEINAGVEEPDLILVDDIAQIVPTGVNAPIGRMGRLSVILGWSANDSVDNVERNHNNVVFAAQNNRNPFVDYPGFVDCIFNGDCSAVAPIRPQNPSTLVENGNVSIDWDDRIESDLVGYNVYRSTTQGGSYTKINGSVVASSSFLDTMAPSGSIYYYVLTSVDTDGNESDFSLEIEGNLGVQNTIIAVESFEDEIGFTITGDRGTFASGTDYFDVFTNATAPAGLNTDTLGIDGLSFLAAEDTNGSPLSNIYTITLDPITITNFTNLEITIGLNGNEADVYDTVGQGNGDFVQVIYSVDSASDTLIGQFTRVGNPAGNNGRLGQDTNLDGFGDVEISDYTRLQDYTFSGIPLGDNLDVKIMVRMDAGNEEVVLDNIRISGISSVVNTVDLWEIY